MQKYYENESGTVLTIEDIRKDYKEFGKEYSTFDDFLECCQDYNNGTLTDLKTYISRLETKMKKSTCPEEREELKLEIEQLKKEL